MSYCKKDGKDVIMFLTEEDLKLPSKVSLPVEAEPEPGLILPSGDINWNCPCLGGMATGPCGYEFRSAFSCFHYSKEEPKGSECFDDFRHMTECMAKYPKLYESETDDPLALANGEEEEDSKSDEQELDVKSTDHTNSSAESRS